MENILQWNCRGLSYHFSELRHIIHEQAPFGICLQETHLRPGQTLNIKGYNAFSKEAQIRTGGRRHGGVAIFTRNNLHAVDVTPQTPLQAIAVRLSIPLQITLVSLYLPDIHWNKSDLEQLFAHLPPPLLVLGDFNSHNTWWGSTQTDGRGMALEEVIDSTGLILLNNGAQTHFNSHNGTFSAIDLSLASPSLALSFQWLPLQELYQSDHFPIVMKTSIARAQYQFPAKYDIKRADWTVFSKRLVIPPLTRNVNTDVSNVTKAIKDAADAAIPRTSGFINRPPVPWWNPECAAAVSEKKRAFNRFKRYPTVDNLTTFKKCRARERERDT